MATVAREVYICRPTSITGVSMVAFAEAGGTQEVGRDRERIRVRDRHTRGPKRGGQYVPAEWAATEATPPVSQGGAVALVTYQLDRRVDVEGRLLNWEQCAGRGRRVR